MIPKNGQTWSILREIFTIRDNLSTFRAENTCKSRTYKADILKNSLSNSRTTFKDQKHFFQFQNDNKTGVNFLKSVDLFLHFRYTSYNIASLV